ncbi:HPr family phosphocarrier protein [Crenobacter sp. SG2305]|uniref:HPr family phosphocarrier protein n=1 Tax=Crenobacter oryzisoli TaxID=3056844 RepID=UPI0025AA4CD1|nr:HPr family phosphocarrier protein [Crenobacter sp. SG2305]MDN0084114.1 HPr family phosphocarrier protein [Crenobacter sp. SG2305]
MIKTQIEIINKLGLHARASSKFTQIASRHKSDIFVSRNGRRVNGKSIMGVMMLAAAKGATIELEISGEDEQAATDALVTLINNRFDEAE